MVLGAKDLVDDGAVGQTANEIVSGGGKVELLCLKLYGAPSLCAGCALAWELRQKVVVRLEHCRVSEKEYTPTARTGTA